MIIRPRFYIRTPVGVIRIIDDTDNTSSLGKTMKTFDLFTGKECVDMEISKCKFVFFSEDENNDINLINEKIQKYDLIEYGCMIACISTKECLYDDELGYSLGCDINQIKDNLLLYYEMDWGNYDISLNEFAKKLNAYYGFKKFIVVHSM